MKKRIQLIGVFLIIANSVLAQDCYFDPTEDVIDYVVSGNFSQNDSGDKVINDIVMLKQDNSSGTFTINTLSSEGNGDRVLNVGTTMINYDLANVKGRMVRGDFDNDGHIDDFILINKTGTSSMRFDLFKSNGATQPSFTKSTIYELNGYDPDKITGRVVSGDFDGDGDWDDIAAFYDYGNGETRIHVWLLTGSSFSYQYSTGWWNSTGYTAGRVTDRVVSGDFDKDGKVDDIAAFYDYGNGETRIHVWLSTGANFWYQSSYGWFVSSPNENFYADRVSKRVLSLNIDRKGENYDDIVALYRNNSTGTVLMRVWKSDETSFNEVSQSQIEHSHAWYYGLSPSLISGRIVDYDSRESNSTQGKPSDIIAFEDEEDSRCRLLISKKRINKIKINAYYPPYCLPKNNPNSELVISAYPNPTESITTIEIPELLIDDTSRIEVHNLYNRLVFSDDVKSSTIKIDLSKQIPGVYMVKVIGRESSNVLKIVKN
ncbi:T9SS type A sorting domain-containing protein [Tenacibaculum halocynthiae]|uniref:T9SS type A sorting domain-containing protein n=1 Tax=Tenacibaculum halocynthiae TaxID=1254437 RepID=UPI003D647FFC